MALPTIVSEALTKFRTMIDNFMSSTASHVPTFTDEELNYLESEAGNLGIPAIYVDLARQANMRVEQLVDPQEIAFLNHLKIILDNAMAKAGVTPAQAATASVPSVSAITATVSTTDEEKKVAADKALSIIKDGAGTSTADPSPVATNRGLTPEQHMASGPLTPEEANTEVSAANKPSDTLDPKNPPEDEPNV